MILYVACVYVFFLWIKGVRKAAPTWTTKAVLIFVIPVAGYIWIGSTGILANFDFMPPPFFGLFLSILILAFAIAFAPLGTLLARNLSYSALIGFQSFRILAELLIFFGVHEGIAPVQLSFEGYNSDILPAVLALPLALFIRRRPNRFLVQVWNWMGCLTLAIIAYIALTSMPTPLRVFMNDPSNVWVTGSPYILLPGVLVTAALTGHILLFRKLKLG